MQTFALRLRPGQEPKAALDEFVRAICGARRPGQARRRTGLSGRTTYLIYGSVSLTIFAYTLSQHAFSFGKIGSYDKRCYTPLHSL